MSRESWLDSESERWQQDGLISAETRRAILARYPTQQNDPSRVLIPLAVLTAGVAVVLFVAWHWHELPASLKLSLTLLLTLALYGGAAWSSSRRRVAETEMWLLAAALGAFALVTAIADIYVWADARALTLCCAVIAAVTATATGASLVTALAATTLAWWVMGTGGGPLPWPFLLLFPLVVIAAEQSRHRTVATLTALAFAAWVAVMAANTWNGSMPLMLCVMLAGAAIEQWSSQPPERRLIFARATPGRAVAIGGLAFALISVVHVNNLGPISSTSLIYTHGGQSPWPALVLAVSLIVIALGLSRQARLIPRVLAVAAALWFNAAAAGRVSMFGPGPWVVLFSAVLLFVGATLVREAARSQDRGTFVLGLAAVLLLVLIHFSSGDALRGSSVLIVSAVVLFLIGRRSRASAALPQEPQP